MYVPSTTTIAARPQLLPHGHRTNSDFSVFGYEVGFALGSFDNSLIISFDPEYAFGKKGGFMLSDHSVWCAAGCGALRLAAIHAIFRIS
ncbi:hypothetical protein EVAR_22443_1 [Eumeta japonica]|uniref:Uncharacterized protein n=1 Tax=Eumeta variegata TaxID=151549 RepID=A0A4C1VBS8_EUMVA|nr:hypothetical protein EVAR_22443_1 [Eumeta japonica]